MKKQHFVWLSLIVAGLAIAVWILRNDRPSASAAPVKIGVILPLTGPAAHIGQWQKNGIDLALQAMEAVEGRPVSVIFEDSAGVPDRGISAYRKLVDTDEVEVVVSSLSSVSNGVLPLSQGDEIPLVMISVSFPGIAERSPFAYRFHPGSESETQALLPFFMAQKSPIAAIAINDDFGRGAIIALKNSSAQDLLVFEDYYESTENNFRDVIEAATAEQPGCIYVVGYVESTATLVSQLGESGYSGKIACNMAMANPSYIRKVGTGFNNTTFCVSPFSIGERTDKGESFAVAYNRAYNEPPNIFAAMAFDAIGLIESASTHDAPGTLNSALKTIDEYSGSMGNLRLDEFGNVHFPLTTGAVNKGKIVESLNKL